ncbi:MAG: GFA family protein [Nitratireductor sp.]|nr:GFA family protein [Nitratireductor sp.]
MTTNEVRTGSCLCGRVRLTISGPMRPVVACHCSQCRKQSGHYFAATSAPDDTIAIEGEDHVKWYRASDEARRGFCRECGSILFWKHEAEDKTSILAGCLDSPTGLKLGSHIYCADKGDYYEITDGLPQS